jgi:hypothetical protein
VTPRTAVSAVKLLRYGKLLPPVRRALASRSLRRLEVGNTLRTFVVEFGEPRSSRQYGDLTVHAFKTHDLNIAATTRGSDPTVLAFTVRRGSKRYKPEINLVPGAAPGLVLRLGDMLFAAMPDPQAVDGTLGANRWDYSELYYLGRPGAYRSYELMAGDLSAPDELFEWLRADRALGTHPPAEDDSLWRRAREWTPVEGYGVYDASVDLRGWPDWA